MKVKPAKRLKKNRQRYKKKKRERIVIEATEHVFLLLFRFVLFVG